MPAFLRYLVILPVAYAAACLAAGFVIAAGVAGLPGLEPLPILMRTVGLAILAGAFLVGPALIAIFVCEMVRIRSLLFWLVFGGVAGLVAEIGDAISTAPILTGARVLLLIVAGLAAGTTYWLIAERLAAMLPAARRGEA